MPTEETTSPPTADDVQAKRQDAFQALIIEWSQSPSDYDDGEEEDPKKYLPAWLPDGWNEPDELSAWVCVTEHEGKTFFLPNFETAEETQRRAVEFTTDDIWPETPVQVVNLDTGEAFAPIWSALPWRQVTKPEAR